MNGVITRKSILLAGLAYVLTAFVIFGGPFHPIVLALLGNSRLGAPFWALLAAGSFALAGLVFLIPERLSRFKLAAFVICAMTASTLMVGIYVNHLKDIAVDRFAADKTINHSFFRSIREAPKDLQFYLHAAALKDCVAYGWSYREMAFYRIPENAAINVLPVSWLAECPIDRANLQPE